MEELNIREVVTTTVKLRRVETDNDYTYAVIDITQKSIKKIQEKLKETKRVLLDSLDYFLFEEPVVSDENTFEILNRARAFETVPIEKPNTGYWMVKVEKETITADEKGIIVSGRIEDNIYFEFNLPFE